MTYNDYRTYILTCEYFGKEPAGDYRKVYDFLTRLWDGMEFFVDIRYERIVLHKGDTRFMYQNHKNDILWCQHERVWTFFQKDMGMEVTERQDFLKSMVEEHLNCKVGTPETLGRIADLQVEEHLNCKVGTP